MGKEELKLAATCVIWSNCNPSESWKHICILDFCLENWILKIYINFPSYFVYMNFRKNFGDINVFFVNKLNNNDTSGNKGIVVYFLLTYNFQWYLS